MNRIFLRGEVERALQTEWEQFSSEHPHLAGVLDQELLIEEATESLRHDPDFNDVLIRAQSCGHGLAAAVEFIRTWIGPWLRRLG
ncbi:MAG: hypothetical protein NZ561_09705 [Phycisphaerae bacterium]|nr:hypothetical protein [Phycisphaerae bacterium]MDW8263331.1 hypothetical protein [Phycisphaerales bacterium]